MSKKMLIDAAHAEETRVVVLNGNQIEDFDFESRGKKQLRGNIYLAKVTRVEPSLQAAFVEYGGNRHGFLAFNEIHPDYYQIPHADREALMREADEEDDEDDRAPERASGEDSTDSLGGDDEDEMDEEVARRRRRLMRRYKIQEVIKRRQIMLIQVVKEERGNKGAALTTYLSLAGRYCVLMPNTDRGGGISRKITTVTDRKRLRTIVADLDVPQGMGLIVRTAGAKRTKAEIKRDYEYLSRAWGQIRDKTLHSIAPALIYEEEDLVKRAIRDLFDKDLDGIWVEGEAGFTEARDFMRMLMPSQAKKIQLHDGPAPLFVTHRVEDQLSQIYSSTVALRSGGYLVINQTEALVAIDVNSGRATRERNIEATALKTNLEAAEEAARQLRLRDLAGLVVIDFIDMDEAKNNRAVEKVLKDHLALDRARIQMGKISSFGLMEISRQRRRSGILEGTTHVCIHCNGAGRVRSVDSAALAVLRAVEVEALNGGGDLVIKAPQEVALYVLNNKRESLTRLVESHGVHVSVAIDGALGQAEHQIERLSHVPHEIVAVRRPALVESVVDDVFEDEDEEEDEDDVAAEALGETDEEDDGEAPARTAARGPSEGRGEGRGEPRSDDDGGRRRGRGRRRRRGGRREDGPEAEAGAATSLPAPAAADGDGELDSQGRRRRRGRRGGRRMRDETGATDAYGWAWPARLSGEDPYEWRGPSQRTVAIAEGVVSETAQPAIVETHQAPAVLSAEVLGDEAPPAPPVIAGVETTLAANGDEIWVELPPVTEKPAKTRRPRGKAKAVSPDAEAGAPAAITTSPPEVVAQSVPEPAVAATARKSRAKAKAPVEPVIEAPAVVAFTPPPAPVEPVFDPAEIVEPAPAPKRGWWRRGA
jgi:ribonuclease E